MIGSGPAFDVEYLSGFDILDLKGSMMRNRVGMFEPAQGFRAGTIAAAPTGTRFLSIGTLQLCDGLLVCLSIGCQSVSFLKCFNSVLRSVPVISVHIAQIAKILQFLLNPPDSRTLLANLAGLSLFCG